MPLLRPGGDSGFVQPVSDAGLRCDEIVPLEQGARPGTIRIVTLLSSGRFVRRSLAVRMNSSGFYYRVATVPESGTRRQRG
jgi:hypothetical protein